MLTLALCKTITNQFIRPKNPQVSSCRHELAYQEFMNALGAILPTVSRPFQGSVLSFDWSRPLRIPLVRSKDSK